MTNGIPTPPVGARVHVRRTGRPTNVYVVVGSHKYKDSGGTVYGPEIFEPTHDSITVEHPPGTFATY